MKLPSNGIQKRHARTSAPTATSFRPGVSPSSVIAVPTQTTLTALPTIPTAARRWLSGGGWATVGSEVPLPTFRDLRLEFAVGVQANAERFSLADDVVADDQVTPVAVPLDLLVLAADEGRRR